MLPDYLDTNAQNTDTLFYDDAPLEAILYGAPGGPSSADLFASSREERAAISQAWEAGEIDEALRRTHELLTAGGVLTWREAQGVVARIGRVIPDVAWPVLPASTYPYETILQPIFDRAQASGQQTLACRTGLTLARGLEARGRFDAAAVVFATLLTGSRLRRDLLETAQYANNLGYERSHQGRWAEAERCCEEAVAGFTTIGAPGRSNNARANLLTARFALLGLPDAAALEAEIQEADAVYAAESDWRRRKTLVLLARIREQAGDLDLALRLMEQSLRETRKVRTQHRLEDAAYGRQLRTASEREELALDERPSTGFAGTKPVR